MMAFFNSILSSPSIAKKHKTHPLLTFQRVHFSIVNYLWKGYPKLGTLLWFPWGWRKRRREFVITQRTKSGISRGLMTAFKTNPFFYCYYFTFITLITSNTYTSVSARHFILQRSSRVNYFITQSTCFGFLANSLLSSSRVPKVITSARQW